MDGWNTTFLLGCPIFRGYVSFREGISRVLSCCVFFSTMIRSCSVLKTSLGKSLAPLSWSWGLRDLTHKECSTFSRRAKFCLGQGILLLLPFWTSLERKVPQWLPAQRLVIRRSFSMFCHEFVGSCRVLSWICGELRYTQNQRSDLKDGTKKHLLFL